jgi:hypothetical protein
MIDLEINDNININFVYFMDIDHIKVFTIKNIFNEIDYLINMINKDLRDIIIKIFIYYKKYQNKLLEYYINLIECLSRIDYIDQYEYIKILINILHILLNSKKTELIINEFNKKLANENDHININKINKEIRKFINNFISTNYLLKYIILFLKNDDDEKQFNNISTSLATEFYMYYNGLEMYNLFSFLIKNHKTQFIKKYNSITETINNLYEDSNQIITKKYKYNFKNNKIINLLEKLIKINNLI